MTDGEDWLTLEELTELLAEVTDASVEEIERASEDLEIAPPEEATVVGKRDDDLKKRIEKLEALVEWNHEYVVLGDPHVLRHLIELERRVKSLEEHRKRIRKIIDEDRELLDALAGIDTEENDDE